MQKIVYGTEWLEDEKELVGILSVQEAEKKHKKKGIYVAVIYEDDSIKYVIEIYRGSVIVRFFNEDFENWLLYSFIEIDNKLFQNLVWWWDYLDGRVIEHYMVHFKANGEMISEHWEFCTGETEDRKGVVDVSSNWEEFPEFGHYDGVIKVERE